MDKTFSKSLAAVAICVGLANCSKFDFEPWSAGEQAQAQYETAFVNKFGKPASNQTWGFGETKSALTRGINNPTVAEAAAPYDETWVATYLATAKEPDENNIGDNYDDSKTVSVQWSMKQGGKLQYVSSNYDNYANYNSYDSSKASEDDFKWYGANVKPLFDACGWNWNWNNDTTIAQKILNKLAEYTGDYNYWDITIDREAGIQQDPTYVRNFKITGTWTGNIRVVASEGYIDSNRSNAERTVVVTGKWNLTESQVVGGLGRIIVANGGEINVASGKTLSSVNEAQIVVLPGGKITGEGTVAFHNGTSEELISYNGGEINVGTFNNNGGDFYNYGTLKASNLLGGAGKSCYYNHGIISIESTGPYDSSSANTRVFNGCQFYCSGNMRIRNYEGTQGSSLICDGELLLSGSMDGTSDASYVGLQAGALVQCGTLYNNGTSWSGPTTGGYAVLDITNKITFLNWEQDAPQNGGYFANNIYVCAAEWNNTDVGGNGMQTWTAKQKFEYIMNSTGNGNVTIAEKSNDPNDEIIPADPLGFVKGTKGCTPGFRIKDPDPEPEPEPDPTIRIIAEDLTVSEASDFDFNDVVFDVILNYPEGKTTIILQAAGGTLPLTVGGQEVHAAFQVDEKQMVNTGEKLSVTKSPVKVILDTQYANANDIPVLVKKGTEWVELTAIRGKVASKIGVKPTYQWCEEKEDIENRYPLFKDYVKDPTVEWY